MTPQELKNSILQRAIQGKLVEQRPEEGTAEELYRQIQDEKQALIKAGKIKKDKPLPEITDDEKLFDIPESWKWVRFGEIVNYNMGKTPPRAEEQWWGKDIPWVSIADMPESGHIKGTKESVSEAAIKEKFGGKISPAGTLIMSFKLTVGRVSVLDIDAVHNEAIISIFPIVDHEKSVQSFLFEILPLIAQSGDSKDAIKGRTLNSTSINNLLIPIPPLAEQKRIVAKIEELLPLIDRYEAAWSRLEEFNKRFPGDMQKSLLQMAIQGKLVEQRPEEGTGEELYQQIQAEKQALIKAGKIKKEKPLSEITDDEKPFDIPESWKWVRLGELTELITKGSSPKWQGINYVDHGLLFVTSENVGKNALIWDNKKYVDPKFDEISPRSSLQYGDLLTNIVGASIGRTAVYNLHENANINQAVCLVRLINKDLLVYLLSYMNSYTAFSVMMNDKVESARANISLTNIAEFLVPLPPLAEQKRIVTKLEELLPLCEKLK